MVGGSTLDNNVAPYVESMLIRHTDNRISYQCGPHW